MIVKSQGLVLRIQPYSRTSQITVWLTPNHGRIATLAKGAYRPKYTSQGQCDLFYTCELLYYPRETPRLNILKECSVLDLRLEFRSDPGACACASYLCDLTARLCPPDSPHPELFDLLGATLNSLPTARFQVVLLFWFELRLLALMGLAPRLTTCPLCSEPVLSQSSPAHFSAVEGGLICADCAAGHTESRHTLTPDVLAVLQDWEAAPTPQQALRTVCSARQQNILRSALGEFLHYHLELMPPSRAIAFNLISGGSPKYN
jgi:DNA repair protein RecO (recombination protein O)